MFVLFAIFSCAAAQTQAAATLSPKLQSQLAGLPDTASVGVNIVVFNASSGLTENHLNILRGVGIQDGVTFNKLGMAAAALNAGQVRALAANPAVVAVWSNDRLQQYMNQARVVTGVDKLRTDAGFTFRNGGFPVSGSGDFSVLVIDSGIDATHSDLALGTKVIQNAQRVTSTNTGNTGITVGGVAVRGLTPSLSIENIPNTDTVGHGTHCAGIVGGTGARSGATYAGVAPGVKIVGSGGGAVIFVLDALAGWEYGLANQETYRIRVITNSYGPIGGGEYNPNHPLVRASFLAYERNITVLWAGGNDGAAKNTLSPYAQAPFVIGVAAGTKEGMLADFSSRGTPRAERLADNNPLNDNDAPTLTAPGNGRYFANNAGRFTSDIASVRASTNLSSNGLTNDTELPVGMIPFYTQISGTSMATPFVAGIVALMLDVDPTLTPDEIKQILTETASRMPGYEDFEVGAGYVNAYAAVDKVYNRTRNYSSAVFNTPNFNAQFTEERPAAQNFNINFNPAVSGPASTNATTFTVQPGMSAMSVTATVDTIAEEGTGNLVGIRITSPSGFNYSTAIDFPVIGTSAREINVDNPEAGTWTLEVRGARGLTAVQQASSPIQLAAPGPVNGTITQVKFILPVIPDIAGNPQQAEIEFALKNRLIDVYPDGNFRPTASVTREDLARSLALNAPLRQALGATARFTDVSGDLLNITEALSANGPSLRGFDFTSAGLIASAGSTFNPTGTISRLDAAVAFVRSLGRDAEARQLAGTTVMFNGSALTDNAQIPAALRGYVQIAINKGLFEAFPAEVRNLGNGQFQVLPGPRFEPNTGINRATFASKLVKYSQVFDTNG
jgi:serine protease AprX